jgi:hypothetical protein
VQRRLFSSSGKSSQTRCSFPQIAVTALVFFVTMTANRALSQEPDVVASSQLAPPPAQTLSLRTGECMTILWNRFGSDQVAIFFMNKQVQMAFNDQKPRRFADFDARLQRTITHVFQDAGVGNDVEAFVKDASQLPRQSRYGTKAKPILLGLPYGLGKNVGQNQPVKIYLCEVRPEDREAMQNADQQLAAYYAQQHRESERLWATQQAAYAAQRTAFATESMAVASWQSANYLRAIHEDVVRSRRR